MYRTVLSLDDRVRLDVVTLRVQSLPAFPGAAPASSNAAGDDEPRDPQVVLVRHLLPPGMVGRGVVVDGDRAGGQGVVFPQADARFSDLAGPVTVSQLKPRPFRRFRQDQSLMFGRVGGD